MRSLPFLAAALWASACAASGPPAPQSQSPAPRASAPAAPAAPAVPAAAPAAAAQAGPESKPANDPRLAAVEAAIAAHQAANDAWIGEYRTKTSEAERKAFLDSNSRPSSAKTVEELLELVEANPADTAALAACAWIASNSAGPSTEEALDAIARHHVASSDKRMTSVASALSRSDSRPARDLLEALVAKSPERATRGTALLSLAALDKAKVERIERVRNAKDLAEVEKWYGKDVVAELAKLDPGPLEASRIARLELVAKDYADVETTRGTLGSRAEGELFELRHLAVGKVAPQIEGEDVDGVAMKLDDFRGKVVLLDFWGHW